MLSETPKTGFLRTRPKWFPISSSPFQCFPGTFWYWQNGDGIFYAVCKQSFLGGTELGLQLCWEETVIYNCEEYRRYSTACSILTLCMLGNFSCFCCHLLTFLKINFFQKIRSGVLSECQMVKIQIRADALSVLIWVQSAKVISRWQKLPLTWIELSRSECLIKSIVKLQWIKLHSTTLVLGNVNP